LLNIKVKGLLLLTLLVFNKRVIMIILKEGSGVKELKVIRLREETLIIRINV